jgi:hypothetical protein
MSDVRNSVRIVDRSSDVVLFCHSMALDMRIVGKYMYFSRKNFDISHNFHNMLAFLGSATISFYLLVISFPYSPIAQW